MSMFLAFWLYVTLNTFAAVFTGGIDGLSDENIMVMPRYDMFGKLPLSHASFIEEIEGVEQVMFMDFLMSDSIAGMSATVFSANIFATVGESPKSGFSSLTQLYLSALYVV